MKSSDKYLRLGQVRLLQQLVSETKVAHARLRLVNAEQQIRRLRSCIETDTMRQLSFLEEGDSISATLTNQSVQALTKSLRDREDSLGRIREEYSRSAQDCMVSFVEKARVDRIAEASEKSHRCDVRRREQITADDAYLTKRAKAGFTFAGKIGITNL
jgi:hypothetical protein